MNDPQLAAAAIGAVAGLIAGSFLATIIIRWPQGARVSGRSACDGCGMKLRAWNLVPLLSWVLQRGRCADCGAPIDRTHPAIETAAALIGAVALSVAPGGEGVALALFGWLLLPIAMLDLRHYWLPDRLTAALAIVGLASLVAGIAPAPAERLIGGAAGFGLLFLIAAAYRAVRGREGLGAGDPKLFGAIGLWLGWQALPLVLLAASALGLTAVVAMHLRGRAIGAATRLPFGTLLAAAAWPIALWQIGGLR